MFVSSQVAYADVVDCSALDSGSATQAEIEECRNKRAISFNPVPGDVSVVFLGNIFGSVDGVLAGSGSQIIGQMYGVFNAALLSFGGIIILYTLMVSTLNTAAEGQIMGQKWSSVWIPIRSVFGLSFLMPHASGYCMMQIIVMWIVLQGIGAADSIWGAALSYLNRGGVLVQKQISPGTSADAGSGAIMNAAMGIAAGQACMQTLNIAYINYQNELMNGPTGPTGGCTGGDDPSYYTYKADDPWYKFCNYEVPDFVSSVNIVSPENLEVAAGKTISQDMPYFGTDTNDIYTSLNGICGNLSWNVYTQSKGQADTTLNNSETSAVKNSRTIAVHQLYTAILTVSLPIVNNAPYFNRTIDCTQVYCADSTYARFYYGYPLMGSGAVGCESRGTSGISYEDTTACTSWGTMYEQSTILGGKELQDAVAAYNGIMLPTLTLEDLNHGDTKDNYKNHREFINDANAKGWLMAGAYFFQVALLNNYVSQAKGGSNSPTDNNSGLKFVAGNITGHGGSLWKYSYIESTFNSSTNNGACSSYTGSYDEGKIAPPFCNLAQPTITTIGNLIVGVGGSTDELPTYTSMYDDKGEHVQGYTDYNVVTYLKNANSLFLPDQKIKLDAGLDDGKEVEYNSESSITKLGKSSFSGGKWGMSGMITKLVWNGIMRPLWNVFLEIMIPPIMTLFSMMISPMVSTSAEIFNNALDVMRMDGVNPIIAISVMGTQFIDGVGSSWLVMAMYAAPAAIFPPAFALLMMLMPIVTGWMGVMLTVGFSAAFYVPFVPILVFTFAGIGWMIGVIEAMTAAPIVALGAIHPEGNEAFGKAEQSVMLLLNMFLRPSLMIIGYIFGIILSYVGVWMMNLGFNMTIRDIDRLAPLDELGQTQSDYHMVNDLNNYATGANKYEYGSYGSGFTNDRSSGIYGFWTGIFLFYFTILAYTSLYMTIVQQAFEMIHYLPDKILRWLSGGNVENLGESTTRSMLSDVKSRVDEAGSSASSAMSKVASSLQTSVVPEDLWSKMGKK